MSGMQEKDWFNLMAINLKNHNPFSNCMLGRTTSSPPLRDFGEDPACGRGTLFFLFTSRLRLPHPSPRRDTHEESIEEIAI